MKAIIIFALLFVIMWLFMTTLNLPQPGELEISSKELFSLINQERQSQNLCPLTWDNQLAKSATGHSQYMAETDDYRHSGYPCAENIMIGINPGEVFAAWQRSALHYSNITNGRLTHGAVGMAVELTNVTFGSYNITINTSRFYTTFMAK